MNSGRGPSYESWKKYEQFAGKLSRTLAPSALQTLGSVVFVKLDPAPNVFGVVSQPAYCSATLLRSLIQGSSSVDEHVPSSSCPRSLPV